MSAPWTADQILDESRVRGILHRRFPDWSEERARLQDADWSAPGTQFGRNGEVWR